MTDDEIEAVARAMSRQGYGYDIDTPSMLPDKQIKAARQIIEALDRVRDARGDDEADRNTRLEEALRQIVRASGPDCTVEGQIAAQALYDRQRPLARSPQGEGHEAGLEAAEQAVIASARARGWRGNDLEAWSLKADARAAVKGYISRVSLSRGGTVAVEDVAEALKRDARLSLGWDAERGEYGLFDRGTREWAIYGGSDIDGADWTMLRAELLLAARPATGEQTDHGR